MGRPSDSRPWSVAEARLILSRVDREGLRGALAKAYDSIKADLDKVALIEKGDTQFNLDATFAFEMYAHTNSADYNLESDWIYGYAERAPLAKVALEMGFKNNFYTYCDLEYARGRYSYRDTFATITDDNKLEYNFGTAVPATRLPDRHFILQLQQGLQHQRP